MQPQAVIDVDHLEKYVNGDDELRDEVLELYVERASYLGGRLEAAQTDEAWKDAAHALKGTARGVGAWALGDLCQDAEKLLSAQNAERRAAIIIEIRREINAAAAHAQALKSPS